MSPEWMVVIDAVAQRQAGPKNNAFADPLERPEWAQFNWISRLLTWWVASVAASSHGYTSSLTRSISPGLRDTVPARKTG
ncbi:hypothetical protein P6U16_21090 [Rhizobium sp. 32-5/1]|uniref:hypothetical protein n=1 Tax=Rhizobium sp. 32-5/1 TaxID=3019602 RepID=UPI00240E5710|nr:hypothetical protein [Rhizobium sp. 32-5/1]WEZ83293.1 hypothetical protein P6U16_21090 [Rhizobium sp. 32-5/1]